jgi:hypothetical protein
MSTFLALKKASKSSIKSKNKPKILDNLMKGYDTLMQAQRAIQLELSPELGLDNKTVMINENVIINLDLVDFGAKETNSQSGTTNIAIDHHILQ